MLIGCSLYLENLPRKVGGSKGGKLKHLGKEVAEEYRRLQTHLETQMLRYLLLKISDNMKGY